MTDRYQYKIKTIALATLAVELAFWLAVGGIFYLIDDQQQAFRIENKDWWFLLIVIPVLIFTFFATLKWKNKAIGRLSDSNLLQYLINPISSTKVFVKFNLFKTAIAFFIIALLNPQFGEGTQKGASQGIEVVVALDISNSMRANDLDPRRSRLKIAKMSIENLLKELHGDKIALVIFAGESFIQVPLTNDYGSLKSFLNAVDPNMISNQGTNINDAIEKSLSAFDLKKPTSKTIILISDGEDHDGKALEFAKKAARKNVIISSVGMGTTRGTVIPNFVNGKRAGLKKDINGNTVTTKINTKMLRQIAEVGRGEYVQAAGTYVNLQPLIQNIERLEKTEFSTKSYTEYQDQFQWFIGIGLVFLIIFAVFSESSKKILKTKLNENI